MTNISESLNSLFKSGILLIFATYLDHAISFVGKALISRYLGRVDFGAVSIGLTIVLTIQIIALLGMNTGVAQILPRLETLEERQDLVDSGLQLTIFLSIILSILAFIAAPFLSRYVFQDPSLTKIVQAFAIIGPFAVLTRYVIGTMRGLELTTPKVVIRHVVRPGVRLLLIAFAISLGLGTFGGILAYTIPFIVCGIVSLWYLWKYAPMQGLFTQPTQHRELLEFSAPLAITGLMSLVLSDIDTYLLAYFSSTGTVGIYHVIYPLANLLTTVLGAFIFLAMPLLSKHHANGELNEMSQIYKMTVKWLFILSLPIFLMMTSFPRLIIQLTFGDEYVRGAIALTILAIGFFGSVIAGPTMNCLTSIGRTKVVMYNTIAIAVVNFGLNIAFIPRLGISGAALATAFSYILLNIIGLVELYHFVNIQPLSKQLGWVAFISIPSFFAMNFALSSIFAGILQMASAIILFLLVHLFVVWTFALGTEELVFVNEMEDKLGITLTNSGG
ncbi:flippase [Halorussus sp. MSC15.2]|uniref:flippase n=1 Tax=Halorussus sp. MSC15.2 TaxID=2283638 RepID=UPI0013D487E5|nr:flippase [Halorussus sp. MSC15.2]NEU55647.1 flippase [Halorussus sp. MSC15.2]